MAGGGPPHVTVDLKQDYDDALAKCRVAAAEAVEENAVKRRKNVQGLILVTFLCLIVVLGIRKVLKPKPIYNTSNVLARVESTKVSAEADLKTVNKDPVESTTGSAEADLKTVNKDPVESTTGSAEADLKTVTKDPVKKPIEEKSEKSEREVVVSDSVIKSEKADPA